MEQRKQCGLVKFMTMNDHDALQAYDVGFFDKKYLSTIYDRIIGTWKCIKQENWFRRRIIS